MHCISKCYHLSSQKFSSARHPMVIVGSDILQRSDGSALLSAAMRVADSATQAPPTDEWKILNVLQKVYIVDQPCVKDVVRVTFTFFSLLVKLELWMLATDQASPPRNSNHSMSFTCWEL